MKRKNKGRTVQRERRIYSGNYLTVHVFPVFKKPGKRCRRTNPSSEVQKRLNQLYREEKLTNLINENFTQNDLEMGLGFDDAHLPTTYEDVQTAVRNFIRRVKRARAKQGLGELKYLYVIEKGERKGRWHIHMIISGDMSRDELEKLWGQGYAHTYRLEFGDEGLKGLAKYKIKEPETEQAVISGKVRRWAASKNLKKPRVPKDRDGYISKSTTADIRKGDVTEREIERLYPGYTITYWKPMFNNVNAGEYLTIYLRRKPEREEKRAERKRGKTKER